VRARSDHACARLPARAHSPRRLHDDDGLARRMSGNARAARVARPLAGRSKALPLAAGSTFLAPHLHRAPARPRSTGVPVTWKVHMSPSPFFRYWDGDILKKQRTPGVGTGDDIKELSGTVTEATRVMAIEKWLSSDLPPYSLPFQAPTDVSEITLTEFLRLSRSPPPPGQPKLYRYLQTGLSSNVRARALLSRLVWSRLVGVGACAYLRAPCARRGAAAGQPADHG
jgi:hypothetical protein